MKIAVSQLRRIIKEEVKRSLHEATLNDIKSKNASSSWFRLMLRGSAEELNAMADAWDEMVEQGVQNADPMQVKKLASVIASKHGFSPEAVSFHLRKILSQPSDYTGMQGADLLKAAKEEFKARDEYRAAQAAKPKPAPKPFDPYADVPYLFGRDSGPRFTGD